MKKYLRLLLVTGLLIGVSPAAHAEKAAVINQTSDISSQETSKQQIQKAFDTWLAAVSSGSSDAVIKLYAKDAVLLPTLSPKVHNTLELRKEYFDAFTAKENLKGTVNEEHIRVFGNTATTVASTHSLSPKMVKRLKYRRGLASFTARRLKAG